MEISTFVSLSIFSDNDKFRKVEDGFFKCQSLLNESKKLLNIR